MQILEQMGLSDFLKNGQLTITKDNVDKVMEAFASFNTPGSPVYDILEKMSTTLGGAQEMTRETIIQSISASIEDSGLLEIWKGILRNADLQTAIQNGIDSVIKGAANFLKSLNIEQFIQQVISMLSELGRYFSATIIPSLKELFGLDEGASAGEVVGGILKALTEFGKGLINGVQFLIKGANLIKEKLLPILQSIGNMLGIDGQSLAQWMGFLITAAPLLSPLVKIFGGLVTAGGALLKLLGWYLNYQANRGVAETITGNGWLVKLLGGSKIGDAMAKFLGNGLLQSVGIIGTGHLISGIVGEIFGGTKTVLGNVAREGTALGSTFIGLLRATNPVIAALGTGLEALIRLQNAQNDWAAELEKQKYDTMAESLEGLQKLYYNSALVSLQREGLYMEGEEASQQAQQALLDFIQSYNFNADTDPQKVVEAFIGAYMDKYATWKAGDSLLDAVDTWLDPNSEDYITGYTKLNKASAADYADKIMAVYNRLLELGFISEFSSDMTHTDIGEVWKHLYKGSQNFGSVEFLNTFYEHLNDTNWLRQTYLDKEVPIVWKVEGEAGPVEDMESALNAAGFEKYTLSDGRTAWGNQGVIELYLKTDQAYQQALEFKEQLQDIFTPATADDLKVNPSNPFDSGFKLLPAGAGNAGQSTAEWFDKYSRSTEELRDATEENTEAQKTLWELIKRTVTISPEFTKSTGGYICPVYRANGGYEMGVDTIPAMLAPGEFVQRSSAVSRAGLSVMEALNHGDLGSAYRLLGAKLTHNVNTQNYGAVTNSDSHNRTNNFVTQIFRNRSGGYSAGRKIGNLMYRH